jgi:hypothetical protein
MRIAFAQSWLLGCTVILAAVLAAGCQQSAPPSGTALTTTQPAAAGIGQTGSRSQESGDEGRQTFAEPPADDLDGGQLVQEVWDAYSMQDKRVGYARTTIANVVEDGRELIRTSNYTRIEMQRGGQAATQELTLTSWDTPQGEFVRFESRMASPGEVVTVGAVQGGQLGIDVASLGRTQSHKLPWQPGWGGLFSPEQSLRRDPLQPGQSRTVHGLLPMLNIPGDTKLGAEAYETVNLPGGPVKLLKVRATLEVAQQKIETILWVNEKGETLKSLVPTIGQEAVRTTKADALRRSAGDPYDLLLASTVPLQGTLPDFQQSQRVVYRARLKSGAIANLFADCPSQRINPIDEKTAELTVITIRPGQPLALEPKSIPPTHADLASNNFIQTDDPQIAAMAANLAPGESDPWKLACAFEKFVDDTIRLKSFSQAFATAAEVCRSLEGDCTEHAVLMAALCRARKIPARVAFGLVYYPPEKGFAYHMWNEVWIADRWVPMDATLGQGGIHADHIKLGDSNLAGGSPLAELLSVIQVFGRLELEVIEAE